MTVITFHIFFDFCLQNQKIVSIFATVKDETSATMKVNLKLSYRQHGRQVMKGINTLAELVEYINAQEDIRWNEIAEIIKANGWQMCDGSAICTDGRTRIVLEGEKAIVETNPVVRMLYPTKTSALAALKESGKESYPSSADDRSSLELADGFAPDFRWSGEVSALRTSDGDIFAWWEE